ncbi:MAG: RDD family protein [Paraglaciecola sp.]|uniref:RDD family protein n=1 Tax=Pseudomonadati TaxID=3379134 RepID=UPI00273EE036|nr:RDD family protein [Paraglaciecola sp.]MDP5032022.1 RDD family protein [Paraglaciecola sp.]MDP5039265.1 RDD family protein [Paraglaciecola sp.]MDP5131936.1 RDD family protein [Paraglaciecola sp.]
MNSTKLTFPRAGFFRRLAAIVYDLLVATAIFMVAGIVSTVVVIVLLENKVLDKQGYTHSMDVISHSPLYANIIFGWSLLWVVGFFLWFWRNGGQTIGMRAWRLKLFSTSEQPFGYGRALLRLLSALGGIGTLFVLFDVKNKLSLQDRIAKTEMLYLSKEANHHAAWKDLQD